MKNRFQTDSAGPHLWRRVLSSVAVTGCGIALLLAGTHSVLTTSSKSQAESLKNATCAAPSAAMPLRVLTRKAFLI